jgi:predicted transcriptional regulator
MSKPTDIRPDAKRLVEQLPADASWDDLAYEVYVRQAIEQGITDADSGRLVEHDTALARVRARIRRAS